ncbi:MAG: ParA family protein, partial [Clostridia bacterium]|nr:ParA family protein [Clostridia bacterium]
MAIVVAFSNQKGGVGKTTSCVNMSAYLAVEGKKTLLIDLDPQGNSTSGLGIKKNELSNSVYGVLCGECEVKNVIFPTVIEGLDIMPSNIDLAGAEVELIYMKSREKILKNAIENIKDEYDVITIDCPPSLGLLTINALTAADKVIIPIQSEYYALEGLSQLMNTVRLARKHLNPN